MKNSKRTVNRITAPVKNFGQRSANLLLILAAAGVLIIGRVDMISLENVRGQLVDAAGRAVGLSAGRRAAPAEAAIEAAL